MAAPDRVLARTTRAAVRAVDDAFGSPADVPDDVPEAEFDTIVEADRLTMLVSGALGRTSLRTGPVVDARSLARSLLARDLDPPRRQAVADLLAVLERW